MLTLENVETSYGTSQVLFGINLTLNEGHLVTLMGRNGMGKTTTVRTIMGLTPAKTGTIRFKGETITTQRPYQIGRAGIALVPEGRQIFPNLSARENLIATASNHLNQSNPWTTDAVFDLFPELADRTTSMGNLLSGGEQQMLAIGRALMTNPKLLILDEATEGLAPLVRRKIWESLNQIRSTGLSILVVDKNLSDLMRLADRHYIIQRGKVVWTGNSAELQADEKARARFLGV